MVKVCICKLKKQTIALIQPNSLSKNPIKAHLFRYQAPGSGKTARRRAHFDLTYVAFQALEVPNTSKTVSAYSGVKSTIYLLVPDC